jgi:hypothetical protein
MFDFESYLIEALNSFENDPADTDYQRGYESGLRDLLNTFMAAPTQTATVLTIVHPEGFGGFASNEGTRD